MSSNPAGSGANVVRSRRSGSEHVLDATALQDALVRRLSGSLGVPTPPRIRSRQPSHESSGSRRTPVQPRRRSSSPLLVVPSSQALTSAQHVPNSVTPVSISQEGAWTCESCLSLNEKGLEECSACHSTRSKVLCGKPELLTLAQMRGLEPLPPARLSVDEWAAVEEKAVARGDAAQPCPICQEHFKGEEQVILSCSHLFHKACLASFERFLRSDARTCPLCRCANFRKRSSDAGTQAWREKALSTLQCAVRCWLSRRVRHRCEKELYRRGGGNPTRRRVFMAREVGACADRLVEGINIREQSVDALFAEFDKGLQFSRAVFGQAEPPVPPESASNVPASIDATVQDQWLIALSKARERGDDDCPICCNAMDLVKGKGRGGTNGVLLTNCSHAFHRKCLQAFENFNIYEVSLCPSCRSAYTTRPVGDIAKDIRKEEHQMNLLKSDG